MKLCPESSTGGGCKGRHHNTKFHPDQPKVGATNGTLADWGWTAEEPRDPTLPLPRVPGTLMQYMDIVPPVAQSMPADDVVSVFRRVCWFDMGADDLLEPWMREEFAANQADRRQQRARNAARFFNQDWRGH